MSVCRKFLLLVAFCAILGNDLFAQEDCMPGFTHFKSYHRLSELALEPVDLTREGVMTPERVESMMVEGCGLKMFFGTERISERVIEALVDLAKEAGVVQKNRMMQEGEVMNFIEGVESENRMVLHTAMRDIFDDRIDTPAAKEAAEGAYQELEKLRAFLDKIDAEGRFKNIVQVGIGGSELGPKAVYLGLAAYRKEGRNAYFMSNVDPDDGAALFKELDLAKTLFVIVSKSGGTLETCTNEQFVREHLEKAGLNPKEQVLTVTGKGSPMDNPDRYLASFYIWDYIGGRYSVSSMVGAVSLAFTLGMDNFINFLHGCHAMDRVALIEDPRQNLPLMHALLGIWNRNFLGHPTTAVIPYSQALSRFAAHLQQLDMESNGKRIDKKGKAVDFETGPIIWGELGTNGQHAFYQCLHQGTTIVPMELIGFKKSQYDDDVLYKGTTSQEKLVSNLLAQSVGLAMGKESNNPNKFFPGNRPNRMIIAERLDPFTMGALLSFYEHKVDFQGFIWNINSFDQEGVQLGKKLALEFIDQFARMREGKEPDAKEFPLGAAYLRQL